VAESLTAVQVQARVAAVSGASNFFLGSVTAYSLEQKVKLLGVKRAAAKKVNCVSAAVAEAMACGVCGLFGADVGVATTGYAEPSAADGVTEPFAWWAVARRGARGKFSVRHGRVECWGRRVSRRRRSRRTRRWRSWSRGCARGTEGGRRSRAGKPEPLRPGGGARGRRLGC
jgi:nicotinamide-nucleotide amidase